MCSEKLKLTASETRKHLYEELRRLMKSEVPGLHAEPSGNTIFLWNGYVIGPPESPYEGGKFDITIRFPKQYPHKPPRVKFISSIFHPNIFFNGEICLEELEEGWNPDYNVLSILLLTQHLLREPNFSSPANPTATKLYRKNKEEYNNFIKSCIEKNNKT